MGDEGGVGETVSLGGVDGRARVVLDCHLCGGLRTVTGIAVNTLVCLCVYNRLDGFPTSSYLYIYCGTLHDAAAKGVAVHSLLVSRS